jgi:hydroxymethylpyrimidine pyrophosphatase-like HAD family hydrolase
VRIHDRPCAPRIERIAEELRKWTALRNLLVERNLELMPTGVGKGKALQELAAA